MVASSDLWWPSSRVVFLLLFCDLFGDPVDLGIPIDVHSYPLICNKYI